MSIALRTALKLGGKAAQTSRGKKIAVGAAKLVGDIVVWSIVGHAVKRGFEVVFDRTVEDKVKELKEQHSELQAWLRDNVVAQSEIHTNTLGYIGEVADTLNESDAVIAQHVDQLARRIETLEHQRRLERAASEFYTN